MFYLFKNKKGIALSISKASLERYITNDSNDIFEIKEISCSSTPTDLYLDENNEVVFPNEDKESIFEFSKKLKLKEIDSWTASNIINGFISDATGEEIKYDSDKDTQITMQGIALNVNTEEFKSKYPNGCPVRGFKSGDSKKTIQYLSADQVLQWCADLSVHIGACKQAGWEKQEEVLSATTIEDLNNIALN